MAVAATLFVVKTNQPMLAAYLIYETPSALLVRPKVDNIVARTVLSFCLKCPYARATEDP